MECTNSHLDSEWAGSTGTEIVTVPNSGYNSDTESNSNFVLGTNLDPIQKLGSELKPDARSGVNLPSGSGTAVEDVSDSGKKGRRKIPEDQSSHFKSLKKWEEDLTKGDEAEHGPMLYAMEKMPEKLHGEGNFTASSRVAL